MTHPRPTHHVFQNTPPPPSYDKFVPAASVQTDRQPDQPIADAHPPSVDRLAQLRREDEQYLESVARSERHHALEELEREKQERHRFRRERLAVKRRVDVADAIKARMDEPLVARLGLRGMIRKRRVIRKASATDEGGTAAVEANDAEKRTDSDPKDGVARHDTAKAVQPVPLVSGYSSSSDEEEHRNRSGGVAVSEQTKQNGEAG